MKRFFLLSIIQVAFYSVLHLITLIGFVGSIIMAGKFESWQVGYGLLVALTAALVIFSIQEAKTETK